MLKAWESYWLIWKSKRKFSKEFTWRPQLTDETWRPLKVIPLINSNALILTMADRSKVQGGSWSNCSDLPRFYYSAEQRRANIVFAAKIRRPSSSVLGASFYFLASSGIAVLWRETKVSIDTFDTCHSLLLLVALPAQPFRKFFYLSWPTKLSLASCPLKTRLQVKFHSNRRRTKSKILQVEYKRLSVNYSKLKSVS